MNICHLKNAELETKHQKYKGRVVLRGDIVKDESRSLCSIQRTRIISITNDSSKCYGYHIQTVRLRRTSCGRSICLYPDKNGGYSKILKIPKSKCPDISVRQPRHKWPKLWTSMEHPVFPSERNLYGHLLAGLLWERQFEKIPLKHGWEKIPNWECLFVHR